MRIYIFGAAGSGTTTQGTDLAERLNLPYLDSDLYFWENTEVPFTKRRDPALRNYTLREKIASLNGYVIGGGSLPKWDESWFQAFDLVIFLYIPSALRIQRLKQRELERYGSVIFEDDERNRLYTEFIAWCSGYDDNTASGRTLRVHEEWIEKFACPVIQMQENLSTREITKNIIEAIGRLL
jgi:adenylate kinase family enzyme